MRPSCTHCMRVSVSSAEWVSSRARLAPLRARCVASERPMPRPAPVTMMVLARTSTYRLLLFSGTGGSVRVATRAPASAAALPWFGTWRLVRLFPVRLVALLGGTRAAGWCEGREHRRLHPGPHFHVMARHLGDRRHRRLEGLGHLGLHEVLLTQETADALLEVLRQQLLNRVAVEADDGFEELSAQHRGAELLLARDDLQQDAARQVLAALVVDHLDALTAGDQPPQILERHMTAVVRVVQTPVGVFAYEAFFGHVKQCSSVDGSFTATARCRIVALVYAAHNERRHGSTYRFMGRTSRFFMAVEGLNFT